MAQISVSGVTFCYEGSYDNIFEQVSFQIDTNWKLGLIGRNGKGKTTFLNLLLGKYQYEGSITSSVQFDYFPYEIAKEEEEKNTINVIDNLYPEYELWKICRELDLLRTDAEILYRPYQTLSFGERTKVMLAVLFSKENYFLLIDEPTNHLDMEAREVLRDYLKKKKSFILVSHDRWILDECVDHVLVLNRATIEVEKGNYSSWWENKQKRDAFELAENAKLKKEIGKLEEAARRTAIWADKVEASKIGFNPTEEHDRFLDTRCYIGEKSRRMQQRRKNLERRQQVTITDKKQLLKNLEETAPLKLTPLSHHKSMYVYTNELSLSYERGKPVIEGLNLKLERGERIWLQGKNGCGKSSIIKAICSAEGVVLLNGHPIEKEKTAEVKIESGILEVAHGLRTSYINQDTSFLKGKLDDYIEQNGLSNSLFKAVLRQLDFERVQFEKEMEEYSEGQKKKVLIASSLLQQAHLYIWDEPLNYIDIYSRMQIEQLIQKYQPTMLLVEHDRTFGETVATRTVPLSVASGISV